MSVPLHNARPIWAAIRETKENRKRKAERLLRKHKMIIHGAVLVSIILSLAIDGGGMADWLFVGLSVLAEIN